MGEIQIQNNNVPLQVQLSLDGLKGLEALPNVGVTEAAATTPLEGSSDNDLKHARRLLACGFPEIVIMCIANPVMAVWIHPATEKGKTKAWGRQSLWPSAAARSCATQALKSMKVMIRIWDSNKKRYHAANKFWIKRY